MTKTTQLTMDHILFAYANGNISNNEDLYKKVGMDAGIASEELDKLEPIGKDGRKYSKKKREIRWIQQSLKRAGYLERVGSSQWQLTYEGKKKVELHKSINGFSMLAFSTKLGFAIWGDSKHIFSKITESITLILTSPPYPIKNGRAYGAWTEIEVIDLILGVLEPIVKNLEDGGSVMLNLGNDCFIPGTMARSMWIERLTLALHDKLSLYLYDRIVWSNPQKAPGPIEGCNKQGFHLATAYEPIIWLCNNPHKSKTNNRRILRPLSENYKKLIAQGGEKRTAVSADGTHTVRKGSFGKPVEGSLPKNIYQRGHICKHNSRYREACKDAGIPVHGALWPYDLAKHFIEFATEPGQLVCDPFGGSLVTAKAAEDLGRHWVTAEQVHEYNLGGSYRFEPDQVYYNPEFLQMDYLYRQ